MAISAASCAVGFLPSHMASIPQEPEHLHTIAAQILDRVERITVDRTMM